MQLLEEVRKRINGKEMLMKTKEGRLSLTKYDPLLFAYIYLSHHLTAEDGSQTLNEFHLMLCDYATNVLVKKDMKAGKYRHTFIAPRNTGKSTWVFTILTIWAAAHGHQKFIAAFSDSSSQAEEHLKTFKAELDENNKLKADFPGLCNPKKGGHRDRAIADNRNQYISESGFVFMVKGADNAVLGMKVGTLRPTWIILDDIEKDESNYTESAVQNRLKTLQDAIFPLNVFAKVTVIGTTTRPGAIIDQIRKVSVMLKEYLEDNPDSDKKEFREELPHELRWVIDENFTCRHVKALISDESGERSLWPEKWDLGYLQSQRHTRAFAKNYQCEPISEDAGYWYDGDIEIENQEEYGMTIISVDPAVTTNKRSDYTGIAVISRGSADKKQIQWKRLYVRYVTQVKLGPKELKDYIDELIKEYNAKIVYVETNQGGDLWKQVFDGVSAKVHYMKQSEKKEERAKRALDFYQKPWKEVVHCAHWPAAEEQMMNFPKGLHDDMVDAIATGILYFKGRKMMGPSRIIQTKYMEV
jgi:phage terminase large subunit-like protein